jgi:hypothetical protein
MLAARHRPMANLSQRGTAWWTRVWPWRVAMIGPATFRPDEGSLREVARIAVAGGRAVNAPVGPEIGPQA